MDQLSLVPASSNMAIPLAQVVVGLCADCIGWGPAPPTGWTLPALVFGILVGFVTYWLRSVLETGKE